MNSLDTPEKQKKREQLRNQFDKDWFLSFNPPQIKRKKKTFLEKVISFFRPKRHSVFALYWWLKKQRFDNENARKYEFPIKHDNMPVKGVPMKYELNKIWTISQSDLKYLYGGPLIDHDLNILVPYENNWKKYIRITKLFGKIAIPVISIIGAIFRWKTELLEFFEWIKSLV